MMNYYISECCFYDTSGDLQHDYVRIYTHTQVYITSDDLSRDTATQ